jgi:outer membrane protein, heavy metal efflux system
MGTKKLFLPLILVVIIAGNFSSLSAEDNKAISLDEIIRMSLKNNTELKAAQANLKASEAQIGVSWGLPNPSIGAEYQNIPQGTLKLDEADMKMYTFTQEIPWPGKLLVRGKISRQATGIAEQEYKAKQRKIINQVKQAYFELYLAYQVIDINRDNSRILEQIVKVAERKYSLDKASLSEALKAQLESSKLENNLISLENQKQTAEAKLRALLNLEPSASVGIPVYQENQDSNYNIDDLYNLAKLNRPDLQIAEANIKQSNFKLALAKREYLPDFMLTYKQRMMGNELAGWDGMFSMSIPLWFWQSQSNMVKQMQAEKEMSQNDYTAMENMALAEIKQMYLKLDTVQRQINLTRTTIIPQAEQVLSVSQTGYQAGKVDFLDLLDTQRMYLETKLEYYMSIVDYQMTKAELEEMVGVDLP